MTRRGLEGPARALPVLLALMTAVAAAGAVHAATEVRIKLGGEAGRSALLAVGLPPFIAEDSARGADALAARRLQEVVRADLLFSRYFELVEEGPHFDGGNLKELLAAWKSRGAGWLLAGRASAPSGKLTLSIQLVDLNSGDSVFERYYRQDSVHLRPVAHRVADDVVYALTGKTGVAHTQIAFSNNQTGHKEIYLVDYDGANPRQATRHRSISLLPRFSPDRRAIAYTSYKDGNPDLFLVDLERGATRALSDEQGLNVAGGFSPDGSQMLMTLSRGRSPNLYVKTLESGAVTRLTQHFGADSSPTFSPDASQAAFVSDRSGNPQIYLLDMTTHRARRLTHMNWCDSPSWSPTGEWIAFAGRAHRQDTIDIFLVDITGGQIRQITRGEGSNENPSWSPDGRFLTFTSTRGGRAEIYLMDADGSAPHKLAEIPGASVTPSWSK